MRARWMAVAGVLGCQAGLEPGAGPTFGGDMRWDQAVRALEGGRAPGPGTLTALGLLDALPVSLTDGACFSQLCATGRAVVLPDDRWLVALGIEGRMDRLGEGPFFQRPPVDLTMALDLSGSVAGAAGERHALVQIATDHLRDDDTVAILAFREAPAVLLERAVDGQATDFAVAAVLDAVGQAEPLSAALRRTSELLPSADTCAEDPASLRDRLEACADTTDRLLDLDADVRPAHPCGPQWEWLDHGDIAPQVDALVWLGDVGGPLTPLLASGLQAVACTEGTDVVAGLDLAYAVAPDGGPRASRVVLASDADGGGDAEASAREGAARYVGLTVFGLTGGLDRDGAGALAAVPGAHLLEGGDPAEALHTWDARFDLLVAPRAWDLVVGAGLDVWEIDEVIGSVGDGANTVFASDGHGVLAVVLAAPGDPAPPLWLTLGWDHPEEPGSLAVPVRPMLPLIHTAFGTSDHLPALQVAARRHVLLALEEAADTGSLAPVYRALADVEAAADTLPEVLAPSLEAGLAEGLGSVGL